MNKNYVVLLLSLFFLLAFATSVSAATVTINCPATNDYLPGTIDNRSCGGQTQRALNVTFGAVNSSGNITNMTVWVTPLSGADIGIARFVGANSSTAVTTTESVLNSTAGITVKLNTFTLGLQDDTSYVITIYGGNSSDLANANSTDYLATANVTVRIDNTIPTCSQSTFVSGSEYVPDDTTLTVTGVNSTRAWAFFGVQYFDLAQTVNDTYTLAASKVPRGTFSFKTETSDGLNTTTCAELASISLEDRRTAKGGLVTYQQTPGAQATGGTGFVVPKLAVTPFLSVGTVVNGKMFGVTYLVWGILIVVLIGGVWYYKTQVSK